MIRSGVNGWEIGTVVWPLAVGSRIVSTITNQTVGGYCYGLYGFESNLPQTRTDGLLRPAYTSSTLYFYLQHSKFKDLFTGLTPATSGFDAKWVEISLSYPEEFEEDQKSFYKKINYDVLDSNLKRRGFFADSFGPAVKDLVALVAYRFNPNRSDVIIDPLDSLNLSSVTDFDIVNVVFEHLKVLLSIEQPSLYNSLLPSLNKEQGFLSILAIPKQEEKIDFVGTVVGEDGDFFLVEKRIERVNSPLPTWNQSFKTARTALRGYIANPTFDVTSSSFSTYYQEYLNDIKGTVETETVRILKSVYNNG